MAYFGSYFQVEFFSSLDGKRVWLASNRVRVEGEMDGGEGDTGRIVNGKMKVQCSISFIS